MVSPDKPTTKNKVPEPIQANVICDTGASISLAPLSIAQTLKVRIDQLHLMSVRGADGKKLSSMGTSFIYMKAPASPSWRRVKVVVTKTGENFLLSHADLKNLDLLSDNFPEYLGERRRAYVQSVQRKVSWHLVQTPLKMGTSHPSLMGVMAPRLMRQTSW